MKNVLNITNGQCAAGVMKKAKLPGYFLSWDDVLHCGPVPAGLPLDELSTVRADFITCQGWGTGETVRQSFLERNNLLKATEQYEKIFLWFEHDLYDQLQLLQILDWFYQNPPSVPLTMVCVDQYLGSLSPKTICALLPYEKPVTTTQLGLANRAWKAFRSETPKPWQDLLKIDTSALPFLNAAIVRLLEEYPSYKNGLSRTAQQALNIIAQGERQPWKIFEKSQYLEKSRFMGDSGFWTLLDELMTSNPPLLTSSKRKKLAQPSYLEQTLTITAEGKDVLVGKSNWLDFIHINRWIGGVHLTSKNIWCWSPDSERLIKRG